MHLCFVPRLSPHECEEARRHLGFASIGSITEAVGSSGLKDVIAALNDGESAEDIAEKVNAQAGEETPSEATETDGEGLRAQFDLDYAAKRLIKSWSYRDDKGRKIPVKIDTIKMLDADTRAWLHDQAWTAMRPYLPEDVLAGNSG